ncbi:hypothetical protein [Thermococcus thioreducens]|uniref:Uncharacterized protein n=1 Tax=Thermococcus thioreducens TaxID=277988 RepID=A0A0Q2URE9_9EURY|nr:hypothetical protein [Thermococcus thioreducens]ASJ13387.1 hypothetical protein A3L14_11065 [Thermococcus thioreducens]KQH83208.1 hypothetical protein AMR53_00550 [Thermococcus thioreducens]SEW23675.1 hypothetical protein SAMN05216170_2323 [Thermococcus thioreducens]
MTFRPAVKHLSLPEEVQAKWQEAIEEFNALKVQVLIDDDELPENATNVLELERLQTVLEDAPAPSRVYVDGKVYKVKLRKRVSREEYKALMGELEKLGRAWWDRNERVIKVLRYEEAEAGEEVLEVEEIVVAPKEVEA